AVDPREPDSRLRGAQWRAESGDGDARAGGQTGEAGGRRFLTDEAGEHRRGQWRAVIIFAVASKGHATHRRCSAPSEVVKRAPWPNGPSVTWKLRFGDRIGSSVGSVPRGPSATSGALAATSAS